MAKMINRAGRTNRSGFTLVELMMAIMSASLLALVVGTMLVSGFTSWRYNNNAVNMQRDASLAMETIGWQIRQSVRGDISVPGAGVLDFSGSNITNVSWEGNQLLLNPGSFPLVRDWVLNFEPTILPDLSVRVILQLFDPETGNQTTTSGTYLPRNVP